MAENQASDHSLFKFLGGLLLGLALAGGYINWGWKKPAVLEVPKMVTGSVIAASASTELYDLSQPLEVRKRALEVIAEQRPDEILKIDEDELGGVLLDAFYRRRARREARQLSLQWTAFDQALRKPALRRRLEERYGVSSDPDLKQAMLWNAFSEYEFLAAWLPIEFGSVDSDGLLALLHQVRRGPEHVAGDPAVVIE